MDFGLAKREAGEVTMTMEGKVLGTPAYMSPEQAKGEAHDADAAAARQCGRTSAFTTETDHFHLKYIPTLPSPAPPEIGV